MRKATLLFAILLAALDIPAQQTPTSITHFLGHAATAFFYSVDATGCTATQASLLLTNGRQVVSPGQKTNLASLFLVLQQSNICGGYSVLIASNPVAAIPASDVTFISSNSATVKTTLQMFDSISNTSFSVSVNLAFTATGRGSRQNIVFHSGGPPSLLSPMVVIHGSDFEQPAVAIGTISNGTTNFTPAPSEAATIGSQAEGFIEVF